MESESFVMKILGIATLSFFGLIALLLTLALIANIELPTPSASSAQKPATASPAKEPTTAEKLKYVCDYLKAANARKTLSEIKLEDADLIVNCKQLGLW